MYLFCKEKIGMEIMVEIDKSFKINILMHLLYSKEKKVDFLSAYFLSSFNIFFSFFLFYLLLKFIVI